MRAAHTSFLEEGYDATTYQSIANRTRLDRALVQYHAPKKKQLAADFLTEVIRTSRQVVEDHELADTADLVNYRLVTVQVLFAALSVPPLSTFAVEALDHRSVVQQIVRVSIEENLELARPDDAHRQATIDDSVVGVGGVYDLFVSRLHAERPSDPQDLARRMVMISIDSELSGPSARARASERIEAATLSPTDEQSAAATVLAALRDHAATEV